jgi:hypothetical protein
LPSIPGESCVIVSAWRHTSKGRARGERWDAEAPAWMRKLVRDTPVNDAAAKGGGP